MKCESCGCRQTHTYQLVQLLDGAVLDSQLLRLHCDDWYDDGDTVA